MSDQVIPFEISEARFEYVRMSPEKVLKGLSAVSPIFQGNIAGAMANAHELFKMFSASCNYFLEADGQEPRKVKFGPLAEKFFTGKSAEMLAFITKCIHLEYGDFLPGSPGHAAMSEAANPFMSLLDVNG